MEFKHIDDLILPIAKWENGCCWHRVSQPFRDLGISPDLEKSWKAGQDQYLHWRQQQRATGFMQPYQACFSVLHAVIDPKLDEKIREQLESHLSNIKAVTFSRNSGIPLDKLLEMRSKYGFRIIVDFDDYWVLNKDHVLTDMWKSGAVEREFVELIREADAVTTTTDRLAKKIEEFNPRVFVIPNAMPLLRKVDDVKWDKAKFGYIAGVTHLNDLETMASVFRRVKDFNFSLFGYDNPAREVMIANRHQNGGRFMPLKNGLNWDMAANEWDDMVSLCSNHGRNPNFTAVGTKTLDHYMGHYDSINVAIAPLADNEFNAHKSSLKAYEAASKGCALICSRVAPFTDDLPEDAVTFCSNPGEWIEAIEKHKDVEYAKEQARKLQDWFLKNRSYDVVRNTRLEAYETILGFEAKV